VSQKLTPGNAGARGPVLVGGGPGGAPGPPKRACAVTSKLSRKMIHRTPALSCQIPPLWEIGYLQLRFTSTLLILVVFTATMVLNLGTSGTSSPKSVKPANASGMPSPVVSRLTGA